MVSMQVMEGKVGRMGVPFGSIGPSVAAPIYHVQMKEHVLELVGHMLHVNRAELLLKQRGQASIAFARQIAMYLLHVVGGVSFSDVGRLLGRDRTTVAHACQLIEERRDNPNMDWALDLMTYSLHCSGAFLEETPKELA